MDSTINNSLKEETVIKYFENNEVTSYPENLTFYRGGLFRKWRWRVTSNNGNIIGGSTQGYWNRGDCEYNAMSVSKSIRGAFNYGN
jgi:uncharacterized protein YegP (UPF0339 family)